MVSGCESRAWRAWPSGLAAENGSNFRRRVQLPAMGSMKQNENRQQIIITHRIRMYGIYANI